MHLHKVRFPANEAGHILFRVVNLPAEMRWSKQIARFISRQLISTSLPDLPQTRFHFREIANEMLITENWSRGYLWTSKDTLLSKQRKFNQFFIKL